MVFPPHLNNLAYEITPKTLLCFLECAFLCICHKLIVFVIFIQVPKNPSGSPDFLDWGPGWSSEKMSVDPGIASMCEVELKIIIT